MDQEVSNLWQFRSFGKQRIKTAHLAHGQDEGENERGEHEVVEVGGAIGGTEPVDKLNAKSLIKLTVKIATKRVVNNTTAASKDSAACIESAASSGTGACVRLVGGRIADRGEVGGARAAVEAGLRSEQVA